MGGLELSRRYFETYGKPMLKRDFPEVLPFLAVGFVGSGSEHYGFDDEISRDHDFEPGFLIFLPGEDVVDRRTAFLLERAYAKLPRDFEGVFRPLVSPVGGNRNGVVRTADFYEKAIGTKDGTLTLDGWLHIPDYALAEAVNGEIFFDNYGEVTRIREALSHMPEDVRKKRIAGNLLLMAQSGQYNFRRCLAHGETEAAQLAVCEFVEATLKCAFLLEGRYMPYYKWSFRALRALPNFSVIADALSLLLFGDNSQATAETKADTVESIASYVISILQDQNLTKAICGDLEKHAYSVNDGIENANLRNMHILAAI